MSDMDWNKHLLDKIEAQAREIEALKSQLVHQAKSWGREREIDEETIKALRADAERGRKLVDWLARYGLLKAEFCTPDIGTICGDWWLLHKPYMIDGDGCEGYGKTEIQAIDAALQASGKVVAP